MNVSVFQRCIKYIVMSLLLATSSAMVSADTNGPVYWDVSQQQVFTADGEPLVGVDFFLDVYDLENMQENQSDYEGYFKNLIAENGANVIRVAPWIKYWEHTAPGAYWYEDHRSQLQFALDRAVQWSEEAGVYLTISYGPIYDMDKAMAFWEIFGARYSDQEHLIFENGLDGVPRISTRDLNALKSTIQSASPSTHQLFTFPTSWQRRRSIQAFTQYGSIDFGERTETTPSVIDYALNARPDVDHVIRTTLPAGTANRWDSVSGMELKTPVPSSEFAGLSFEVKSDYAQSFWVYLRDANDNDIGAHYNTYSPDGWTTINLSSSDFNDASSADIASIQFFIGNDANFDDHNGNNFYFDNMVIESSDGSTQENPGFVYEDGEGWLTKGYNQTSVAITREEADTQEEVGFAMQIETFFEGCCSGNRWNNVTGMALEFPFPSDDFVEVSFDVKADDPQGFWVYMRGDTGEDSPDIYNYFNTYAGEEWTTVTLNKNDFSFVRNGEISSVQFFVGVDANSDAHTTTNFYFDNIVVTSSEGQRQGARGTTDESGTGWSGIGYGTSNTVVERVEEPSAAPAPTTVAYDIQYSRIGGTDYYVSPNGDDTNDGLSESTPLLTPQVGADMLQAGDRLLLMPGYYETGGYGTMINLTASGTPSNWISIEALETGTVEFKVRGNYGVVANGASYVRIKGLTIEGLANTLTPEEAIALKDQNWYAEGLVGVGIGTESRNDNGEYTFPHHIVIEDNLIRHMSGGGIGIKRADYVLVQNNVVHNNAYYNVWAQSGISIWESHNHDDNTETYRQVITGNVAWGNYNYFKFEASSTPEIADSYTDGIGIIIDALAIDQGYLNDGQDGIYSGRTLVENNITYGNGGKGINLYASDNIDVIHNVSYKNGTHPEIDGEIALGQVSNIRMYNNIIDVDSDESVFFSYFTSNLDVSHNIIVKEGGLDSTVSIASDTIEANPLFRDAANFDFSVMSSSPAIDAATDKLQSVVSKDGVARPQGLAADIGAFEQ